MLVEPVVLVALEELQDRPTEATETARMAEMEGTEGTEEMVEMERAGPMLSLTGSYERSGTARIGWLLSCFYWPHQSCLVLRCVLRL